MSVLQLDTIHIIESSDTFPPPLTFVFIYLTKMQIEASKE